MVQSMQAELSEAPREIAAEDSGRLRGEAQGCRGGRGASRHEEENFVRLTLSKKDKAKEKLRRGWHRGCWRTSSPRSTPKNLASCIARGCRGGGGQRSRQALRLRGEKRRTLARYLNDIEQKARSPSGRQRRFRPAGRAGHQQPKRRKPDYSVHDDSDAEEAPAEPHVEDELYGRWRAASAKKQERKAAAAGSTPRRADAGGQAHGRQAGATRDIIKNKGLAHRNKLDRNPREEEGQVRQEGEAGAQLRPRRELRGRAGGYAGESTGINKLSRSTRL